MSDKKDFNPERDIEFTVVSKIKKKVGQNLAAAEGDNTASNNIESPSTPVMSNEVLYRRGIFFDYNSSYYQELFLQNKPSFSYVVVKDLSSLTQALKTPSQQSLFINWSVNPKAYEQLLPQISSKFPSVHIVISGTDLNQNKAKEIKEKYSFVKNFLVLPTSLDQLKKILQIT